jgi:hypothetical protein
MAVSCHFASEWAKFE